MSKLEGELILRKWRKNRPTQRFPLVAILDNIRSAYNVGSMLRTAACAYIKEVVMCGITAHPPNTKLEKTALGCEKLVPWRYFSSTVEAIRFYKGKGFKVVAIEITSDSQPVTSVVKEDFPMAVVFGNEVWGVEDEVLKFVDGVYEVPLYGEKESLNVAVCFGVAIFLLIEKYKTFQKSVIPPLDILKK